jgi:hypothetical protein
MDQRHQQHQQQQGQHQQHHQPMQTGIGGAVANSQSAAGANSGMMMGDADNNNNPAPQGLVDPTPRKEIYTYTAPWTVFAMAWSRRYVYVVFFCVE